jgi:hypothetical protein
VAHGVRHLAFLVRSGEAEEARGAFGDEAYKALSEVEGDMAGLI